MSDATQVQQPAEAWYAPWRVLVTAIALAVVAVMSSVPIPGLDTLWMLEFGVVPMTLMGTGLFWLVAFKALAAWARSPDRDLDRILFVFYLLAVGVTSWMQASVLQSVSLTSHQFSVVVEPGYGFLVVATLTATAGNALLWPLASWVSRSGSGTGALLLCAPGFVHGALSTAMLFGEYLGTGMGLLPHLLLPVIAVTIVLVALAAATPPWPAPVLGTLQLRSPLDLLVLPSVVSVFTSAVVWGPFWESYLLVRWLPGLSALAIAIALVAWLIQQSERRASPLTGLLAVVPLLLAITAAMLGFLTSGGLERAMTPGPFDGPHDLVIEVGCPTGDAATSDKETIVGRLDSLGIRHSVRGSGSRLKLELYKVVGSSEIATRVLPAYALSFHEVIVDPNAAAPLTVQECDTTGASANCWPVRVGPVEMDHTHISEASVQWEQHSNEPTVLLRMTGEGQQLFGDLSTRLVNHKLAIVVDGEIVSAPVVREPILGGSAQIAMGAGLPASTQQDAYALAAALNTPPMSCSWALATVNALGE